MRPVCAPHHPVRRSLHDLPGKRHRIVKRRSAGGHPLTAADFHPAFLVTLHQLDQGLERQLLDPVGGFDAPHVVDRVAHGKFREHVGIFRQVDRVEMQIDVPGKRRDHRDHPLEHPLVGHAPEMANEVEPAAPHPALMQLPQLALADAVVDVGNSAVAPAADRDRIERDAIVGAVHARIDDHGAPDAEPCVQRHERFQRRIGRRVGPVGSVRVFRAGAKDMTVRVARQRRQLEFRRPRVGIRSGDCRREHARGFSASADQALTLRALRGRTVAG